MKDEHLYNERGQVAGTVRDGRLLKSGLDPTKHQLKYPPAWAIDKKHVQWMGDNSTWGVEITTIAGDVWCAPIGHFLLYGKEIERGEGIQVALPLNYWTVKDSRQMPMF